MGSHLAIVASTNQEVEALKRVGVNDSIGLDLVPHLPNVIKGDFHHKPFNDGTFDFEFSNVFDHVLYPDKFAGEIKRTLKPGGICVLHVALSRWSNKYSANDLYSVEPLKKLFNGSDQVSLERLTASNGKTTEANNTNVEGKLNV
nr:S-adenosyl-L-methionine-dependent methyltransferases superfamily protein [Tanacetum cinerariifolium]